MVSNATFHPLSNRKAPSPESNLEILRWAIFESFRLEAYSNSLTIKEIRRVFSGLYWQTMGGFVGMWLVLNLLFALADVPGHFPELIREGIARDWALCSGWEEGFWLLISTSAFSLFVITMMAFLTGYAGAPHVGLTLLVTVILAQGVLFLGEMFREGPLLGCLLGGFAGLGAGPHGILFGGRKGALVLGLPGGAGVGFAIGIALGPICGACALLAFYFSYFRLFAYPIYLYQAQNCKNPHKLPYVNDALIFLPLGQEQKRFTYQAFSDPDAWDPVTHFLLKERPLQRELALNLKHAICAGYWYQHPLEPGILDRTPHFATKNKDFSPCEEWWRRFLDMKKALLQCFPANQEVPDCADVQRLISCLQSLHQFTKEKSSPKWNHYYFPAFRIWEQTAIDLLNVLNSPFLPISPEFSPNAPQPSFRLDKPA